MKLHLLVNPDPYFSYGRESYRGINVLGTWRTVTCVAGRVHGCVVEPLRVEWTAEGGKFGDVAWQYGGYEFICTRDVFERLNCFEDLFEARAIEPAQSSRSKRRESSALAKFDGFVWPVPRKLLSVDPGESQLEIVESCDCGHLQYGFRLDMLAIDESAVADIDAFCVKQIDDSAPTFVTEGFKREFESFLKGKIELRDVAKVATAYSG
jgi:hypothetical protein